MDLWLTSSLGIVQILITVLGVWVSLRPPEESRAWIVAFVIVGFFGVGLAVELTSLADNKPLMMSPPDCLTSCRRLSPGSRRSVAARQNGFDLRGRALGLRESYRRQIDWFRSVARSNWGC